jgi:hypothetical protein
MVSRWGDADVSLVWPEFVLAGGKEEVKFSSSLNE